MAAKKLPPSPPSPPAHDSKSIAVPVIDMEPFNDNLPSCPAGAFIPTKHDEEEEKED
jgi:hypothetical protein